MISICVPCYEMHGLGCRYLTELLNSIKSQTFRDFEVIVSDQSDDLLITNLVETYKSHFDISYYHCDQKGKSSYNLNNAISKSKYPIIKPMFQDDFFIRNDSLSLIASASNFSWGGITFTHFDEETKPIGNTITPRYNPDIKTGVNTFGSPSVCFFKNDNNYFNNDLVWLMDCCFYETLFRKYGMPTQIACNAAIGIRVWKDSYTNHISEEIKELERNIVGAIYG